MVGHNSGIKSNWRKRIADLEAPDECARGIFLRGHRPLCANATENDHSVAFALKRAPAFVWGFHTITNAILIILKPQLSEPFWHPINLKRRLAMGGGFQDFRGRHTFLHQVDNIA